MLSRLGIFVSVQCLSACGAGAGADSATAATEPPIVNVTGPGQFKDPVKLRTMTTADIADAIQLAGATRLLATPRYAVEAHRLSYVTLNGQDQEIVASALVVLAQKSGSAAVRY